MEIRNALSIHYTPSRQLQRPADHYRPADNARAEEGPRVSGHISEKGASGYRTERFARPAREGQLIDRRLAFEMHQAARREGLAGTRAYGEQPLNRRASLAISAYETHASAARFGGYRDMSPALDVYV